MTFNLYLLSFLDSENTKKFLSLFINSETLEKLVNFQTCRCVNVIHGRLNFHSCPFPKMAFLPAFVTSGKLLSNIWWSHQILDLSKCSYSDDFFEGVKDRPAKSTGFSLKSQSEAKDKMSNIFEFQRAILYHQGERKVS